MSQALEGEHYCIRHQGNHSHYDEKNCTVCKLEKQLSERDAALARCVEALQKASYALFQIKRMVPEAIKEHAIKSSDAACEVLNSIPASAQATAKVLAAARRLIARGFCYEIFSDLEKAIREERAQT